MEPASARDATLPVAAVVTGGRALPPWAARLDDAARLVRVSADARNARLEKVLDAADAALLDGEMEAPLSAARRVHRLAPALQLVVVSHAAGIEPLRRAALFTPGLGEPWLVVEGELTPELLRRAADVATQRRRHARRIRRVASAVEALPPPGPLSPVLSDQYLATLLELLPGPVLALDEEDRIVFANPAANAALGLEPGPEEAPRVADVLGARTPGFLEELLGASRRDVVRRQLELRTGESTEGVYELVLAPVPGERPLRALLLHDVTERVQAHERLEEQAMELEIQSEELHVQAEDLRLKAEELSERTEANRALAAEREAVLDNIADGVVIAGADGAITFMNAAARRIHGGAPIGVRPEAWTRAFGLATLAGDPYPPEELPLARALREGRTVEDAEWLVRRPDGSVVHALGSAAPVVDFDGRRVGAVLTLRDVTAQRRQAEERERLLEERDRALSELREVMRQRSRFYASMSHELRTPINAIIGYTDLLLGEVFGEIPADQREAMERATRAARHLHDLVNDILDLSKIEAGKLQLEPEPVAISDLIEDLTATMDPLARSNDVELRFDVDASCTTSVRTDPRRLRQILMNLLSNAIRYGRGEPVDVRCRTRDEGLEVEVRDHGSGIPAEKLESIFDEFVQLENGEAGGTGLGLSISRALARSLGGELRVQSEVGRGSTFTVRVPPMPEA